MAMRRRNPLVVASALLLGLTLSGCGSFDPTDWFSTKKRLSGERKAVFPEGVPGVPYGVPPELVQGYQPPPEPPPVIEAVEAEEKPKPQPKRTPRPRRVAEPARAPAPVTIRPAGPAGRQPAAAPWPAPQQTASQPAPSQGRTVFPDPPPPSPR